MAPKHKCAKSKGCFSLQHIHVYHFLNLWPENWIVHESVGRIRIRSSEKQTMPKPRRHRMGTHAPCFVRFEAGSQFLSEDVWLPPPTRKKKKKKQPRSVSMYQNRILACSCVIMSVHVDVRNRQSWRFYMSSETTLRAIIQMMSFSSWSWSFE